MSGAVIVVCPLTVGGSFEAKTSAIEGQLMTDAARPNTLNGELVVDLSTLDTGIDLRNTHLRERYLEIAKGAGFAKATLTSVALEGGPVVAISGSRRFTGVLTVHGVARPVAGEVRLRSSPSGVHIDATFPMHLADYDIAKPRYLGVGVKDDVQVKVAFEAGR